MKKTLIILALLVGIVGCREREKEGEWITLSAEPIQNIATLEDGSREYTIYDSLGNMATMDSCGAWAITGDTLSLLTMITEFALRKPNPVVLIVDSDTQFVRPGDTIRVTTANNEQSIKYANNPIHSK